MFAKSSVIVCALALVSGVLSAPVSLSKRQNPCFVTGSVALPAEVADSLAGLSGVTCNPSVEVIPGVPDVTSNGVSFSSIDFQKSKLSPVGFALESFKTPCDPAKADLDLLQNQLNVYLAVEAGVRSQPNTSAVLAKLKGPKFFLQFQIARARTALGEQLGVADTVEHQLGKVTKNAVGASADEIAQVEDLATTL
ncbi:hypothetical protein EXIGLDRAFT_772710 [Exidia glandulosa HHB12029]|uniref:DUF7143 domain-containing protein n=1 Tax=Exidia glandulosa HHB12029 TaxID=1314781 RepID=A0A165F5V2_EXIGL|nr:hypothetical protein EXIGLDRAFT_772710 [Exidia glandulosa HHB12029]